jgi:hypothetical protein
MVCSVIPEGVDLAPAVRRVPVGTGDFPLGDIVLSRGRSVTGRVLDESTGAPLEGVSLSLSRTGKESPGDRAVMSRADGSFQLQHANEEAEVLHAEHEDYAPATVPLPAQGPVELRLARLGRIFGELQGRPVGHLRAMARLEGSGVTTPRGEVDEAGHFVIRGLVPGSYVVRLLEVPEEMGAVLPVRVTVPEHGDAHATLVERPGGATLHVQITGGGAGELFFVLLVPGARPLPASVDELNVLRFSGLESAQNGPLHELQHVPPGVYTLFVLRMEGVARISSVPITVGEQDQTVEIELNGAQPLKP